MAVCLDTCVLIYALGGIRKGHAQRTGLEREAIAHLHDLDKTGESLMLPAPALSEYLMGVDEANQDATSAAIMRQFEVAPFDIPAAARAAKLWRARYAGQRFPGSAQDKAKSKFDLQIVAIATARGVGRLCTTDAGVQEWARTAFLPCYAPPPIMGQSHLGT